MSLSSGATPQSFGTLKSEFQKLYKQRHKVALVLDPFSQPGKRADFVMAAQEGVIQIIEIKRPKYALKGSDLKRIITYIDLMERFLGNDAHKKFRAIFHNFHVTLVCDALALESVDKRAFQGLKDSNKLTHIDWTSFLLSTRRMHEDFLNEAERQKRHAAKI